MKLFNRGNDAPKPAPGGAPPLGPAAAVAVAPAPAAQAPAPAPVVPELTAILDANVKDMSEKIAKLASTVESQTTEKGALEAKLEQMEERMRKLSSLTEMISAQYNPFVGDAPSERELLPAPEVGLAPPPVHQAGMAPSALAQMAPMPSPELQLADLPPMPELSSPDALIGATFADDLFPAEASAHPQVPAPVAAPEGAPALSYEDENPEGVCLWSAPSTFEASLVMLSWADLLMKQACSREGLLSLLNYYHNIGWIGDPARDQLLAYADGIAKPPPTTLSSDWRAPTEVHERSLLYLEKLRMIAKRRQA